MFISLMSSSTFVTAFETKSGYWPAMEMQGYLKIPLDTLMDKHTFSSWQIYDEKNGSVVVIIRFVNAIAKPLWLVLYQVRVK